MTGVIAAELRKLTSVRTHLLITLIGLALVAVGAGFFVFEEEFTGPFTGTDGETALVIDQIGSMSVIVLIVGLLAMTTEFRHGTIGRTLQLTPSRTRVLGAKMVVSVLYAIAFFAAGLVVVMLLLLVGEGFELGAQALASLWQGPAGLALTAIFGVALGALLRNQVIAISVSLIYVFLGETLVNQFAPRVARWMPFQALNAVFLPEEAMAGMPEGMVQPLDPMVGLTVFVGYVVVAASAALALLRQRDV